MAPKPDGPGYRDENGQVDVVEWIVTSCTGFFTGDEETITQFGEDPVGWCATNLPPECGPEDISRCMPEILERCHEQGGDSESAQHLARYCGTFSQNSSTTYSSHHESSSQGGSHETYTSGSHCACDTVVNEICYTVNVYHQTNIYVHVENETTTTGCFGDRTPCTTTEIDDDFGCEYPVEFPTWDPDAPTEDSWGMPDDLSTPGEGTEAPGTTTAPPGGSTSTSPGEKAPAAEAAADVVETTPEATSLMPGIIKEPTEPTEPSRPSEPTEPPVDLAPPAADFGAGSQPVSPPAAEAPIDAPAEPPSGQPAVPPVGTETDTGTDPGFGSGADASPVAPGDEPSDEPAPDPGFGAGAPEEPVTPAPVVPGDAPVGVDPIEEPTPLPDDEDPLAPPPPPAPAFEAPEVESYEPVATDPGTVEEP